MTFVTKHAARRVRGIDMPPLMSLSTHGVQAMPSKEPVMLVVTPTWAETIPILKVLVEHGSPTAQATAWTEIERMAIAADSWNRLVQTQEASGPASSTPVVSKESLL